MPFAQSASRTSVVSVSPINLGGTFSLTARETVV